MFMLHYKPFISKLEGGGTLTEDDEGAFLQDFEDQFGAGSADKVYVGGLRDLRVHFVGDSFRLREYDGLETISYADTEEYY
jgi:hypothetical protein